jgi:hypothetical protein
LMVPAFGVLWIGREQSKRCVTTSEETGGSPYSTS